MVGAFTLVEEELAAPESTRRSEREQPSLRLRR
jgi:hypothetical protein